MLSVNTGEQCCGFSVLCTVGIPFFAPTQILNHTGLVAVGDLPHMLILQDSLEYLVNYFVVEVQGL